MEVLDNPLKDTYMKIVKYILIILVALAQQSCLKDPQSDVNDGGWNHERSIIDIKFENQVGKAVIENTDSSTGEIALTINAAAVPDLSNIKLSKLQTSYQAMSSVAIGEVLNFENETKTASLTVTATTGETREYKIYVTEFIESIVGVWDINKLVVYGGTGAEYGGGGVMQLADKSWCWSDTYGPQVECDNFITFTMTGITDDGNTKGVCLNNAGADGKYADFIFEGAQNKDNPGVDLDLKKFYRQIPEGESTWERNYAAGTITFVDASGKRTTGSLVNAGTEDLGNGLSMAIENNAFAFNPNGTDDWNNIYSDYDKFAKKVRRYWVCVTKR